MDWEQKYLKYKIKYLDLLKHGGAPGRCNKTGVEAPPTLVLGATEHGDSDASGSAGHVTVGKGKGKGKGKGEGKGRGRADAGATPRASGAAETPTSSAGPTASDDATIKTLKIKIFNNGKILEKNLLLDLKKAFIIKSTSTGGLFLQYLLFNLCTHPFIIDNGKNVSQILNFEVVYQDAPDASEASEASEAPAASGASEATGNPKRVKNNDKMMEKFKNIVLYKDITEAPVIDLNNRVSLGILGISNDTEVILRNIVSDPFHTH